MAHRAPVVVAPYSSGWPDLFSPEYAVLSSLFPPPAFRIEHIGSTAIPGLPAKPIIDLMLGASSLREVETQIAGLARLGYEYLPEHEQVMPERRFFAKPVNRPRLFHLHAAVLGETFWNEHLLFRDALCNNPRLAAEYGSMKLRLAAQFGEDRDGYTNAKSSFITSVIRHAALKRGMARADHLGA
jgi:GrpB-like predicted nucleotidyltransferase (UPF0157 family)